MKKSIHWMMAALMAFEPALATEANAKIQAELQTEFRRFIELSGVTQKEVSLNELYDKFQSFLPREEAERLTPLMTAFGQTKLPKMQVGKIKTPAGHSAYKLSYTQNGQSGDLEFFGEAQTVYRLNGKNYSSEKINLNELSESLRLPAGIAKNLFPIKNYRQGYLSAEEVARMSKEDQRKYLREFQSLLSAAEQAQNIEIPKKSAAILGDSPFFVLLMQEFVNSKAQALTPGEKNCTVGGHIATAAYEMGGRLKCGTIAGGKGTEKAIRGECTESVYHVQCNTALFGPAKICVLADDSTTKNCMEKAVTNDIPDFADKQTDAAAKSFNDLKTRAQEQIKELLSICSSVDKMESKGKLKGIVDDQKSTCARLKEREATVNSWSCGDKNSEFNKKYQNICKERSPQVDVVAETGTEAGTTNPAAPTQTPSRPPEIKACKDMASEYTVSDGNLTCSVKGTSPRKAPDGTKCRADDGSIKDIHSLWYCACSTGSRPDPKNGCSTVSGAAASGESDSWFGKAGKWISKNSQVLTWIGVGLLGLFSFYWLSKQQAKQYYDWMNPTVPNPPVVPNGSAPVPRSTQ